MNNPSSRPVFLSVVVVKIILVGFTLLLASLTVLTQIAQYLNVQFQHYALISLPILLLDIAAVIVLSKRSMAEVNVLDRRALLLVFVAGILGAALVLANRTPDDDDFYYVPNAVFYIQHPTQLLNYDIRAIHVDGEPLQEVITFTSFPYEYIQAIVAHFSGLEYLFVYYLIFPALIGFLIPLAYYLAFSYFQEESNQGNIFGVFVMMAVILLLGETPWTIGSLSFARAFQGKIIFLALGPPLFTAFSYEFFRRTTLLSWACLFLLSIAMLGLTATTIAILPALASVLGAVHLFTSKQPWKRSIRDLIFYGLTLGYILLYALIVRQNAMSTHGMDAPQNQVWPTTFIGHLSLLVSPQAPSTIVAVIAAFLLSLAFSAKRKDILLWVAFSLLIFLNPWTAPYIIQYVTSPNIYWRMFYILPFPFVIGIGAGGLFDHLARSWDRKKLLAFALGSLIVLAGLHIPLSNSSVFRVPGGMRLGWPGYKIEPHELSLAREVVARVPPGPMLAPLHLGGTVTLISSDHPQMITRKVGIINWMAYRGRSQEARLRVEASAFVNGESSDFVSFKKLVLMHPDLTSIVMVPMIWQGTEVQAFLEDNGFLIHQEIGNDLVLIWR